MDSAHMNRVFMKIAKTIIIPIFGILLSPYCAGEPSPTCALIENKGGKINITNKCNEEISLAYCHNAKGINQCGLHQSKHNPYYQLMTGINPGEIWSRAAADVQIAICAGDMHKYASDGLKGYFDSAQDGSYTCWPEGREKKAFSASGKKVIYTAAGTDLNETCARAKALTESASVETLACTCTPLTKEDGAKIPVYRCQVESDGLTIDSSLMDRFKASIRQKVSEHCKNHANECAPSSRVGVGVRD